MQLQPYIIFYGRCEEALEFYKRCFGGSFEMMRFSDTPMTNSVAAERSAKVMHASFTAPGVSFLASDGSEDKPIDPEAGNISVALSSEDTVAGGG